MQPPQNEEVNDILYHSLLYDRYSQPIQAVCELNTQNNSILKDSKTIASCRRYRDRWFRIFTISPVRLCLSNKALYWIQRHKKIMRQECWGRSWIHQQGVWGHSPQMLTRLLGLCDTQSLEILLLLTSYDFDIQWSLVGHLKFTTDYNYI